MKVKLIVTVYRNPIIIKTVSVYDTRTGELWTKEQIKERGIEEFISDADLIESLCWNTNSDGDKSEVLWSKNSRYGTVYLYD